MRRWYNTSKIVTHWNYNYMEENKFKLITKEEIADEITIEKSLFDEYYVAAYKDQLPLQENKYYCINLEIALLTADVLKKRYPKAKVLAWEI